jgi:hypothetical protein
MLQARIPSVKIGPMKCCMLGVKRNGTGSNEPKTVGLAVVPAQIGKIFYGGNTVVIPGSRSLIVKSPVLLERWKRPGRRLMRQKTYVMKEFEAT